jgi:DNA repair protein RecO (recombination protein O)
MHAIVLRQVDYGEADRIVSLLSAERGRLEVRIPSARKSRKRFGGLDLFVLAEATLAPGRGAPRLAEARVVESFPGIRLDVVRLALAGYAAELLLQAAQEEHEGGELFRLAVAALGSLDRPEEDDIGGMGWARAFELKLLHVLGSRPSLRRCAVTGEALSGTPVLWSVRCGGVLSPSMRDEDPAAETLSADVVRQLDRALHLPLARQTEVGWTARQLREARGPMRDFVGDHVGGRDKALRFLEGVLPALLLLALIGLGGCVDPGSPSFVRVQGYLYSTPDPVDADGVVRPEFQVPGADGTAWTDAGELLAEASVPFTDHQAYYRFDDVPAESAVHLVFEPPRQPQDEVDYVATVLSGRSAREDLYVDAGAFHIWSRADAMGWVDDWFDVVDKTMVDRPTFDPEVDGEGGIAVGRVLDAEEHLGLRVVFRDPSGFDREAWYTHDDGAPTVGEGISQDGGFAVFGMSPGPVEVLLFDADGTGHGVPFVTRFEEDGVTSLFGFGLSTP